MKKTINKTIDTPEEIEKRRELNRKFFQYSVYGDEWECPKCARTYDPGCGKCECGYKKY
jgi:hypothetical protein